MYGLTNKDLKRALPDNSRYIAVEVMPEQNVLDALFTGGEQFPKHKDKYRTITYEPKPTNNPQDNWVVKNGKWVNERNDDGYWMLLRYERDKALTESDWTQLSDASVSTYKRGKWKKWRQELRDLPTNYPDPDEAKAKLDELITSKPNV